MAAMEMRELRIRVPEGCQLILGQSHFIKTVEDIYEALVTSSPSVKFGVAFCEASGKALVRYDGTDDEATQLAKRYALELAAGHAFLIVLKGSFPINVLDRIKAVEEVATVFCATSNEVTVAMVEASGGRGIIGVVDGVSPKAIESDADRADRHEFLRKIGYKR